METWVLWRRCKDTNTWHAYYAMRNGEGAWVFLKPGLSVGSLQPHDEGWYVNFRDHEGDDIHDMADTLEEGFSMVEEGVIGADIS